METAPHRSKLDLGPTKQMYDVIVVGGQIGGALSAALLAKRGYRVLLIEHDGMGQGYEHHGYLLPFAPFIAPQLKAMPRVEEALAELGLNTAVQRALKPHQPDLQLVLPKNRFDLSHDDTRRRAELTRALGSTGTALDAAVKAAEHQHEQTDPFFKDLPNLPPDGFMETWALKSHMRKHPSVLAPASLAGEDPATRLLLGILPFLHYVAAPKGALSSARPLSQILKSPHRFPGGREGLREILCKRLLDLGGDLLGAEHGEASVVGHFLFDGGKVSSVSVLRSGVEYKGHCVVGATDAGALRRLVQDKRRQRKLTEVLDAVETPQFLFTVNWVVKAEAIPCGMGELVLVDLPGEDFGPMLVQLHSARRVGKPDQEDARVVCAAAFVPSTVRDLGEAALQSVAEKLAVHLDRLMPFARKHLLQSSAPYLDAGGVRGSRLMPHPLYEIDAEDFLGVTGLRQRTPVKNFFLASREVLPGLGLEGEFLAGIRAAKLVHESFKKKDPLKS